MTAARRGTRSSDAQRDQDGSHTRLVEGTAVIVGAAPHKGVRGVVEEGLDGQRRIVVNVALLGRAVRTILTAADVLEDRSEVGR